jgi:putative addiction module component (TIGR02574 family)
MSTDLALLGLEKPSVQERLELIEKLWDSLPEQLDARMIPDWHLAELAKRRAEAQSNPGAGRPWREMHSQLGANP